MKNAQQLVQEHLRQDEQKQKKWYDRKAREMKIEVGDQVLLLLLDKDSQKKFMRTAKILSKSNKNLDELTMKS